MNSLDESIIKIVSGPTRINTKTTLGFKVVAIVDCWGCKQKKTFWAITLKEAKKFKPGYTYIV